MNYLAELGLFEHSAISLVKQVTPNEAEQVHDFLPIFGSHNEVSAYVKCQVRCKTIVIANLEAV